MIPVAIGNWIGGGFLIAFPFIYLYAWESRTFKTIEGFLYFNFVPTMTPKEVRK